MPGESQQVPDSHADPTVLTTEALIRAVAAERDYVDGQLAVLQERLRGIDRATELLNETVNRTPTDITKEITHLRELMQVELASVAKQFAERDTRSEREARDNKLAVDAAFAAQEKQAKAQNESNTESIRKSELGTAETIKTNQELTRTSNDAFRGQLDDLKERIGKVESTRQGATETRVEQRANQGAGMSVLAAALVGLSILVSVGVAIASIATR